MWRPAEVVFEFENEHTWIIVSEIGGGLLGGAFLFTGNWAEGLVIFNDGGGGGAIRTFAIIKKHLTNDKSYLEQISVLLI